MTKHALLLHLVTFFRNVTDYVSTYKALEIPFQKQFLPKFERYFEVLLNI